MPVFRPRDESGHMGQMPAHPSRQKSTKPEKAAPGAFIPMARVQGAALWRALGFTSAQAFQRARRKGWARVALYPIPGQARGVYARSDELARFLAKTKKSGGSPPMDA